MQARSAARSVRLRTRIRRGLLVVAVASLLVACGGGGDAGHAPSRLACRSHANDTPERLLGCVTLAGVRGHQAALVDIAQRHGGSRETGSPGYDASVDYVKRVLRAAGYVVTVQAFQAHAFESLTPSVLEQRAPLEEAIPSWALRYSGSGDVTAPLAAPAGATACAATDFPGFVPGHIALVRRGGCEFRQKATNAFHAGAAGVVVYNREEDLLEGNLQEGFTLDLPVVGITRDAGERLVARLSQGVVVHLKTQTVRTSNPSYNVLAETTGGDPGYVAMLGAHLDSVAGSPGSNDNASGVAALLETATQMAAVRPRNRLRFAFWGAEEQLLFGSLHYLENLSATQKAQIALYLNFDMIGSPNPAFFTYAEDGETAEGHVAHPGAGARIERVFQDFYRQRGLASRRTDTLAGDTDHSPFHWEGIPVGGIWSGNSDVMTQQEAALWGGQAGLPYDPCWHRACDGLANNSDFALATNADAVAWAALYFAMHRLPR